jgi:hypothetical protein
MSFDAESANDAAAALNAALKPLADRPVDITDPTWLARPRSRRNPLDEAGVRREAEALLASLLDAYVAGDESDRTAIRGLFARNRAFTWATGVAEPPTTAHGFRRHLLRISAENGGADLRDTIVMVDELCMTAEKAGVDVGPVLEEVAALSSAAVVNGMTSVRSVLLNARQRYSKRTR